MQRFQPILLALTLLSWLSLPIAAGAQQPEPAPGAETIEIVAFGDSLSAGYGVGPGEAFPEQLQVALRSAGYNVAVANAGVSGDTTTGGLARLEWSVPPSADLVIVELGANDALRGVSPQIAADNLDRILATLAERDQAVILAGMLAPPNMGDDYGTAFEAIYPRLAEEYDVPLYPFFLDGVAGDRSLNLEDAMHPNREGIAVIVERMLPTITMSLDRIIARRGTTG
jgi:acyl-CoA thioesterase-1